MKIGFEYECGLRESNYNRLQLQHGKAERLIDFMRAWV